MTTAVRAWPTLSEPSGARTFLRMRWLWLGLEGGAVVIAWILWGAPPVSTGVVVALGLATHLALSLGPRGPALPHLAGASMVLDALRLTALLALTGGASTPLSAAYLVYVVLAALLVAPGWTAAVTLAAVAGYGSLFLEVPPAHHHHDMRAHLVGMWVSVALVAPFVAGSIVMLRRALSRAAEQVELAREASQRDARLSTVGTLAAGAAHELATPLNTIAVAAGELGRHVQDRPECARDILLVQEQVARCRDILHQLAADVGAGMGELHQPTEVGDVLDAALAALDLPDPGAALERIELLGDDALLDRAVVLPVRLIAHVLSGLVKNALQASDGAVDLEARDEGGHLVLEVRDRGAGMPAAILDRAREPFFTTKAPGQGTGLGLFVADSVARQLGGTLRLESRAGEGTTVALILPWEGLEP